MKKGFTLIELMAAVIIIALVALLTFPNIVSRIKEAKDENKDNVEKVVISSSKKYVNDNIDSFNENNTYCLSIKTLIDNDYLKEDIVTDEDYNISSYYVKVKYEDDFNYEIVKECNEE